MTNRQLCIFVLLLNLTACSRTEPAKIIEADIAITNANVIAMTDDSVQSRQSVFVKDGKIIAIGHADALAPAASMTVIDGSGKFLIPGLADMHVHAWNDSELVLYVANGVTLVRNMWGEAPTLEIRDRINAGETLGPRIVTAGRLTDGDPPIWGEYSGVARSAEEAAQQMDEQRAAGYDFFKIYAMLTLETFDGVAAHSKKTGFPFAGHVPAAVPLDHAFQSGMSTNEHLTGWAKATLLDDSPYLTRLMEPDSKKRWANNTAVAERLLSGELTLDDLYDRQETQRLAELAAAEGIWHVPTLSVNKRIVTSSRQAEQEFARPEMRFMSPQTTASWDPSSDFRLKEFTDDQLEASQVFFKRDLELVRVLHEAGAPLLAGTDAPNPFVLHGFAMHEELGFLVEAGLTPYEALVTATRAPAEFLGEEDEFGTIAVNRRADLVLLNANPLSDIAATREIAGVVVEGAWHPKQSLDAALEAVADSFALPDDWFDGVAPLASSGDAIYFDRTQDENPVGAARVAIQTDNDGDRVVTAQNRWRSGNALITASIEASLASEGGLANASYETERSGTTSSINVRNDDGTIILSAVGADGSATSQELDLPQGGLLMLTNEACMPALLPRLERLAVGESVDLDLVVFDTFGVRLVEEQWSLTREDGDDNASAFAGTVRRGSVESELSFSHDQNGLVSYQLIDQFGTSRSVRRE